MYFLIALFLTFSASASVFANYDFTNADDMFLKRGLGREQIRKAIDAYKQALNARLTNIEKVYANEQIAALHLYHGFIVDQSDYRLRIDIANACINQIATIAPSNTQPRTPQYYYWRAACMLARADAAGITSALSEAQTALDLIAAGSSIDAKFEGGGFDRLAAIMYAKLPAFNPFGPTGDLPRALRLFRRSLDSGAYVHPLNPAWRDIEYETGNYFYSTHFYYAEALVKDAQYEEARSVLEQALAEIEAGEVAPGRHPETAVAKARMIHLLESLD